MVAGFGVPTRTLHGNAHSGLTLYHRGGSRRRRVVHGPAAVAVSGVSTVLQAVRVGRIGAGYVLLMGTSGAFIAVSVTALAQGGPAMLATLVVISALFQFVLAARFSLLRRVLTPTVAGTVIMLIAVTVMPIVFDTLKDVPEGAPPLSAPLSALVTVLVITGLTPKATGSLRLWAPSSVWSSVRWSPDCSASTTWHRWPAPHGSACRQAAGRASI